MDTMLSSVFVVYVARDWTNPYSGERRVYVNTFGNSHETLEQAEFFIMEYAAPIYADDENADVTFTVAEYFAPPF